ncbi:MAG: hypothetical protein RRY34_00430 [Victivallaceae bacterium]
MNKIGFFKMLYECCKGTAIFSLVPTLSIWRAMWHLFLLAVLSSLFVGICNQSKIDATTRECTRQIEENFGKITFGQRIVPEKSPQVARLVFLTKNLKLFYLPEADLLPKVLKNYPVDNSWSIFWTPEYAAAAIKEGDAILISNIFYPVSLTTEADLITQLKLAGAEFQKIYLQIMSANRQKSEILQLNTYSAFISSLMVAQVVLTQFIQVIRSSIMFILLFYIFSFFLISFSFKNNPAVDPAALKTFSYANLAKIAIYAGIPAAIIGSFFPAFNLPYLSYDRIYFIITGAYSFFIIKSFAVNLRLINRKNSDEDDF